MSLPTFTRVLDQAITDTWVQLKAEVTDNILRQTPLTAILQANGCMVAETGGTLITRTVGYGQKQAVDVELGDVITSEQTELDTVAMWRFKKFALAIQRNTFTDRENQGEAKVKDYVARQMEAAVDALAQKFESDLLGAFQASETTKRIQGFNDMIPPVANRTTGTYGGISRPTAYTADVPTAGNTWWSPRYRQFTTPVEVNLESDMRRLYNTIADNTAPPDQIITTQALFELYEEFASDRSQIVIGRETTLANLGFDELYFKGKSLTWSPNMPAGQMLFLNTAFIELVYDPTLWFAMGEWVSEIGTERRQANIICTCNLISTQLRRHGRLYT